MISHAAIAVLFMALSPLATAQDHEIQLPICSQIQEEFAPDVELLNTTGGPDLDPLLKDLVKKVRKHWYSLIPKTARPPQLKPGRVVVKFFISRDGRVSSPEFECSSGDQDLDKAAWRAVAMTHRTKRLPKNVEVDPLLLRFVFKYNPKKESS